MIRSTVFNTSWFIPASVVVGLVIITIIALYLGEIIDRWRRMMRHIRRYGVHKGPRRYHFDERGHMTQEDGERW